MKGDKVIFSARSASIGYPGRILCRDISFDIREGETILLCGANGSGKSTLLRSIAEGRTGHGSVETVMVPTGIPKVKGFTLKDFIRTSLYRESRWNGKVGKTAADRIDRALDLLGLGKLASRDISTLSDGEFQKGTIAAALCRTGEKGGLILLDEPTAFLDPENKLTVFRTLGRIAGETGLSFVFASHDLAPALSVCTSVWALGRDGVFRSSDALPAGSDANGSNADCSGADGCGSDTDCSKADSSGSDAGCSKADGCGSGAGSRFAGLIETIFSEGSLMNRNLSGGGIFK